MNWDAIGSIAEGLGAAGVIVTLAFLVGQLRANARLMRSESERITSQMANETGLAIAQSRELAELFAQGLTEPTALDRTDRTRFTWLFASIMNSGHVSFVDFELGLTTSAESASALEALEGLLDTPGGQWFWQRNKTTYRRSFVEAVDRRFELD